MIKNFQIIIFLIIGMKVNGQTIDTLKTFDSTGNLITVEFIEEGIRGNYILNYEYDQESRLIKEFATDTLGEILPRIGLSEIMTYKYEKEGENRSETTTYFDKDLNPSVNDRYGFHKVKISYNSQNQKIEEWFFAKSGITFERIGFKYNKDSLLSEVNYLNDLGGLKEGGLAIVKLEYDEEGRVIKKSNFDSEMKPFDTSRSPYITEINYLDGVECKSYYDANMKKIKTTKFSICEKLENFYLPNGLGKLVDINEDNGKIKIIHFWASWSGPCKYMNKNLVKLYERIDSQEIEIISISLEKEGNEEEWKRAIEDNNLSWDKHLCDFKHWKSEGANQFDVRSLPKYFLIDENGYLIGNNLRSVYQIEEILIKKKKL